jgi:transposase
VAESHVPSREVRELRSLVRRRASLVRQRSHLKHQAHSILLKNGAKAPMTDIFGKMGKKFLQQAELPYSERLALDNILAITESFDERISLSDTAINGTVETNQTIKQLTTIPGIGNFSALLAFADIDSIKRFKSAKHLCSYAGLVPSVYQSGNTTRRGSITKTGSRLLRWVLVQSAHKAVKSDLLLARYFKHLQKKRGTQKAIVAVARKILTYMYIMLTEGIEYQALNVNRKKQATPDVPLGL